MARSPRELKRSVRLGLGVASVGLAVLSATPARAITPKQVDDAVDKAVAHLLSTQKDGNWEKGGPPKGAGKDDRPGWIHFGGQTAAATYALLVAGVSPQDPHIKKAIEWLENNDVHGTYVVGFRSNVWAMIPEKAREKDKLFSFARDHDRDFVLYSRIQRGRNMGYYSYVYGGDVNPSQGQTGPAAWQPYDKKGPPEGSGYDRSNSQYGVLGAWAVEQAGAEVPTQYWLDEDAAWKKGQSLDGGWSYGAGEGGGSTATMTCAGLATLFITQDYVLRTNFHQFDTCKGGVTNENIEKGLKWMDKHIGQDMGNGGNLYLMYGVERVGVASGRKYFGTLDWFKKGAESIVKTQGASGGWGEPHATCWATVFLCRGRAPVMMNKLQYETADGKQTDPWNERPRDVANLAKWMGKHSLEGYLNWQIVNLKVDVDDLHDAPILYISGSTELSLSNQEIAKLRQFVEQGGMILGNADCGNRNFAGSFRKLGQQLFPKYEFRRLPNNHLIFDEQYHAKNWKSRPMVEGMSNGIRELLILVPDFDPSKAWQTESFKIKEEAFQLAGNIFLYSTGKENLTHKGDTYIVHAEGEAGRDIKVARIQQGENWDPEPGGWRRLSAILSNERHVGAKPTPVKLGENKLAEYKIAHWTGTTKVTLNAAQRKEIKDFVDGGGTLVVDAAGGSVDFADTVEKELNQIFGAAAATGLGTPLPATHAIYTDSKIEQINYRTYARRLIGGGAHEPRVRGITVAGGRVGVFYSREDLTAGLVGEPVDGVLGYVPQVSTQIMANIVMYGEKGGKGAPVAGAAADSK